MRSADSPGQPEIAELARHVDLTADWLNRLPLDRLSRRAEEGSIAQRAHQLATEMLLLQLKIDPRAYSAAAPNLPQLQPHAAGSQLKVVGRELLRTLARYPQTTTDPKLPTLAAALLTLRTTTSPDFASG